MKFSFPIALAALPLLYVSQPVFAASDLWTIDSAHSSAHFRVKHMMVSNVSGDFSKITGTVHYDGKHLGESQVSVAIDPSTIDTNEPKRDEHLKSADFFDVAKYPEITFKSKQVKSGTKGFKIIGDLTMHGVTKEVTLNAEPLSPVIKDPRGINRIGTSASATVNRQDFGVTWNKQLDNGGVMISDDVVLTLDVELTQKPETAEAPITKSSIKQ
jgi:polyisoprenoid-binding protein YceI